MSIEIKAPNFPESVADGVIASWHKAVGDACQIDELLVSIETDKIVLEVVAPNEGVLVEILKQEGEQIDSEELLAVFRQQEIAVTTSVDSNVTAKTDSTIQIKVAPAARKLIDTHNLDVTQILGTGKNSGVTKEDVINFISAATSSATATALNIVEEQRIEERVPMTRLRTTIAKRLLEAQQNSAMLTTYNEVNMLPIMTLREQHQSRFTEENQGVRLGYMSFFVKAVSTALQKFPSVNASLDGNDIVYHGFQDIGVAVSTERGLMVPVLRNAEHQGYAEIEKNILEFSERARNGKLGLEDMQGGTFTISNGGVFGSLLSTPILNPPQTAILGMHKIQERPMAVAGKVVILPMMYLALSYDHRMIDGKEAVQFLNMIKGLLETPSADFFE